MKLTSHLLYELRYMLLKKRIEFFGGVLGSPPAHFAVLLKKVFIELDASMNQVLCLASVLEANL